jgi:hypothetical protein
LLKRTTGYVENMLKMISGILSLASVSLTLAFLANQAQAGRYDVAVVIGNSAYGKGIPKVDYAGRDADAIRHWLINVRGVLPDNIIDVRNATKAQLESTFGSESNPRGKLWRYADPTKDGEILVFYSGHGIPGLENRESYLLPTDAEADFVELSGYPLSRLVKNLGIYKKATLLIDACFSGTSDGGTLFPSSSGILISPKAIKGTTGLTILTASSASQLASWDHRSKHGLFTEYFLRGVYGEADADNNGNVNAAELKEFLDESMTRIARRTYGRVQNASLSGSPLRVMASFDPGRKPNRPKITNGQVVERRQEKVAPPPQPQPRVLEPQVVSRQPPPPPWKPPQPQVSRDRPIERLSTSFVANRKIEVYRRPGRDSARAGIIKQGRTVQVTGWVRRNGWLRISRKNGREGFIPGNALPNRQAAEVRRWEKATNSGRAQDYMDYIRHHANGLFVDLALVFVRELAQKALGGGNFKPRPRPRN